MFQINRVFPVLWLISIYRILFPLRIFKKLFPTWKKLLKISGKWIILKFLFPFPKIHFFVLIRLELGKNFPFLFLKKKHFYTGDLFNLIRKPVWRNRRKMFIFGLNLFTWTLPFLFVVLQTFFTTFQTTKLKGHEIETGNVYVELLFLTFAWCFCWQMGLFLGFTGLQ